MKSISNARQGLNDLKNDVIGIYKHSTLGVFELVISVDKQRETIETCFISQFGAIQRGFSIPYQQGQLKFFPDNKNMNQMLDNPFEFDEFEEKYQDQEWDGDFFEVIEQFCKSKNNS